MIYITSKGLDYLQGLVGDIDPKGPGLSKRTYIDFKILSTFEEFGAVDNTEEFEYNYNLYSPEGYTITEEERRAMRSGLSRLFEAGYINKD